MKSLLKLINKIHCFDYKNFWEKICNLTKEKFFRYSFNQTYFFWLLFCLIFGLYVSTIIIRPFPTKKLDLEFLNGVSQKYVFEKEDQDQLSLILSEALGATLNLSWYDICFYNKSFITKQGKQINDSAILEIDIYPLNTNKSMIELQKGLDFPFLNNNDTGSVSMMISGKRIAASRGLRVCTQIKDSEGGIEYRLSMLEKTKDRYGTDIHVPVSLLSISKDNPYPLEIGPISDSKLLNLGDTDLFIKNNSYAFWVKKMIMIFIIFGVLESIRKIFNLLFPKKSIS